MDSFPGWSGIRWAFECVIIKLVLVFRSQNLAVQGVWFSENPPELLSKQGPVEVEGTPNTQTSLIFGLTNRSPVDHVQLSLSLSHRKLLMMESHLEA